MSKATAQAPVKRGRGRPRQDGPSTAYLTRQAEIIDTAVTVFGERGYDQASLDDVAAVLGTGRTSLYHYVDSKSHLLYLIFNRAISSTLEEMEVLATISDPAERLRALLKYQITIIAENPKMFTVFFGDRPALDARYEAEIRTKERRLLRQLIEAVKAAADAGLISVADPRLAAQALLGMTSWLHKWFDPGRDDPEEFVATCERLVFGARAT